MAIPQKRSWLRGFGIAYRLFLACLMEWCTINVPDTRRAVLFAALATGILMHGLWDFAVLMKTSPDEPRPVWSFGLPQALLAMSIFAGSLGMRAEWGG